MARRSRIGAREIIIGIVIAVVVVGVGVFLITTKSDSGAGAGQIQVATAQNGTLAVTVDAPFTLAFDATTALTAPSSSTSSTQPSTASRSSGSSASSTASTSASVVLTQQGLAAGAPIPSLAQMFSFDGAPVFGVPSAVPFYRDLVSGEVGYDVASLQFALNAAGYPLTVNGTFDSATVNAVEHFQTAQGVTSTGRATLSQFASFPPGAVVLDLPVSVGQHVATGATVADVGSLSGMIAQAQVGQADVTRIQAGQAVELDFDALSGARATGKVENIPTQAASSSGSSSGASGSASGQQQAGTAAPVEYLVSIRPDQLPAGARVGMTGQAHVTIQGRTNVVIVPSSAIGGTTDAPTVQLRRNGQTVTRPVIVGLVTASEAEIISGVHAGDVVVTGTLAPAGSVPTTTPGLGGGGRGIGGGGGNGGGGSGRGFGAGG